MKSSNIINLVFTENVNINKIKSIMSLIVFFIENVG